MNRASVTIPLFLMLVISLVTVPTRASSEYWTQRKAAPAPIFNSGAAVVNDQVYVVGGFYAVPYLQGVTPQPSNLAYDPSVDSWKILAPMITPRESAGVVSVSGKIYALGGDATTGVSNRTEVYDPSSDSWATLSPMPVPTDSFAYTAVNSTIYVMGGIVSNGPTRNTWAFNTTNDQWIQKSNMPGILPQVDSGITAAVNGKIYVAPRNAYNANMSFVYNIASDSWTDSWNGPPFTNGIGAVVSMYSYAMTLIGDTIFMVGGIDSHSNDKASAYNFQYNTVTGSWTRGQDMPTARCALVAASLEGLVFAIGGGCGTCETNPPSGTCLTNEAYNPAGNQGTSTNSTWLGLFSNVMVIGIIGLGSGAGVFLTFHYIRSMNKRSKPSRQARRRDQ